MDDIINLILRGCRLARELELNMPNMANQPNRLAISCEEIIQAFSAIREQLVHNPLDAGSGGYRGMQEPHQSEVQAGSGSSNFEGLLGSSGYGPAASILQQTQYWSGLRGARMGDIERREVTPEPDRCSWDGGGSFS
ncbi:hypothetical protein NL676_005132 [Syzygium grande]|nr:hypothetical protein NL676_005132 [Syzygium grande]